LKWYSHSASEGSRIPIRIFRTNRAPSLKEIDIAIEKNDKTVLNHIDRLVKEEEHLYGKASIPPMTKAV
jgi:hypothetical protein